MASHYCFILILLLTFNSISTIAQIQAPLPISSESEVDVKNYTGIISERYANGSPSLWKTLNNGKSEGLWLEWYPNGNLRYRAYWKDGLGHGKWEYFHLNGNLRSESFYIADIAQGIYRSYHENGKLESDASYLNGKKDGVFLTYDKAGTLVSRQRFENDTLVIDEPIIFGQGIFSNPGDNEWGIHFSQDGNTAYFTRRTDDTKEKRIHISQRIEGQWTKPKIAPFSTDEDESPFISEQRDKLFFASYRPLPDGSSAQAFDMNIWYMDKTAKGWSSPQPLSNTINKSMKEGNIWPANYEAGPVTDKEGNLYFWTKGSKSNGTNLFFAELRPDGSYKQPIELIEPSSHTNYDTAPYLSPDGSILFFSSDDRYDGYGDSDIYYSKWVNGKWSKPKNLGPNINSSKNDGFPSMSPDGKYFYFSSDRGANKDKNGESLYDIYYLESKFLIIE